MDKIYNNWAFIAFSILSIISCALIITVYYRVRELHYPAFRLVKDLTVINLIYGFALMIPSLNDLACQIQGMSIQFMTSVLILWTAVIAHSLDLTIVRNIDIEEKFYRRRAIVAVLVTAGFLTVLPFAGTQFQSSAYGATHPWCWLANLGDDLLPWQLGVFYVPCALVLVYDLVVTILVLVVIHREENSWMRFEWSVRMRLWLYPCVILIPFGPCALLRVTEDPQFEPACAIAAPMSGILTTLIYGLTEQVRSHLCPCLWKQPEAQPPRTSTLTSILGPEQWSAEGTSKS